MDDKFKKRIMGFYVAGFFNLALGLYVLINGKPLVEQTMWYVLIAFFFGFAAVDFWFARKLRKQWIAAYKEHQAKQEAAQGKAEIGSRKAEGA